MISSMPRNSLLVQIKGFITSPVDMITKHLYKVDRPLLMKEDSNSSTKHQLEPLHWKSARRGSWQTTNPSHTNICRREAQPKMKKQCHINQNRCQILLQQGGQVSEPTKACPWFTLTNCTNKPSEIYRWNIGSCASIAQSLAYTALY